MVHYPQVFHAEANASEGIKETWEVSASEHKTECAIPKAYEGSGEAFSPEEFFLLSMQNCFIASFKVYAEHMKLNFDKINVSADLVVNVAENKSPTMELVEMNINLYGAQDKQLAQKLIDKAIEDGFIFNSIKTNIKTNVLFDP